jgi:MFS family permease
VPGVSTAILKPQATKLFLPRIYTIQALGSVGGTVLGFGIFFYMRARFGWGAGRNLCLSCASGAVYVFGALAADPLSRRFYRQRLLRVLHIGMALLAVAGAYCGSAPPLVALLLAYSIFAALQWPLVESLICTGAGQAQLSRRIMIYNLVWSVVAAGTSALCGVLIARFAHGLFFTAAIVHGLAVCLLLFVRPVTERDHAQLDPEPELIPMRTTAKRLSRIALPSTYAVINSLRLCPRFSSSGGPPQKCRRCWPASG